MSEPTGVPANAIMANGIERGFAWQDDFALGDASMDAMHRQFVASVDALLSAAPASLGAALDDFERHARRHFGEEDEAMRASRYDAGGCHIDEHAAVLESLRQVQEKLAGGHCDVVRAFARALARWFPEHVRVMDQGLAQWLEQQRLGGAPIAIRRRTAGTSAPAPDEGRA